MTSPPVIAPDGSINGVGVLCLVGVIVSTIVGGGFLHSAWQYCFAYVAFLTLFAFNLH